MTPEDLVIGFGRAVRSLREQRGLSQEQLGHETGIHRNYIGGVERGERQPTVVLTARLADAFETVPSELIGLAERLAEDR